MCFLPKSPKIPNPVQNAKIPQAAKSPESAVKRKFGRERQAINSQGSSFRGTLLTGSGGVTSANVGGTSLLGS